MHSHDKAVQQSSFLLIQISRKQTVILIHRLIFQFLQLELRSLVNNRSASKNVRHMLISRHIRQDETLMTTNLDYSN